MGVKTKKAPPKKAAPKKSTGGGIGKTIGAVTKKAVTPPPRPAGKQVVSRTVQKAAGKVGQTVSSKVGTGVSAQSFARSSATAGSSNVLQYPLSGNQAPASVPTNPAATSGLDPTFAAKVQQLIAASGGRVWLVSGHRSTEKQTALWNAAVARYGAKGARQWVAPPGRSNHERGIAVDLGGDLRLAAQLAPQFGLFRPMSWEPWHFEPSGSRSTSQPIAPDPRGRTERPDTIGSVISRGITRGFGGLRGQQHDHGESGGGEADMGADMGGGTEIMPPTAGTGATSSPTTVLESMLQMGGGPDLIPTTRLPDAMSIPRASNVNPIPDRRGGGPNLDNFVAAIRAQESGGNYRAVGAPTKWGRATGAYQFLDSTWNNYKGFRRAMDAPPHIQDERARQLMQQAYDKYGNWSDVAAFWFSGPGGKWKSREVQRYVSQVMGRLG